MNVSKGGMYYPYTWTASNTPSPNEGPKAFEFEFNVPIDDEHCMEETSSDGCRFNIGIAEWYANYTYIHGEATLPDEMYDEWSNTTGVRSKPWASPGTAKTWGDGCGVNGGNPHGCGKGEKEQIRCQIINNN